MLSRLVGMFAFAIWDQRLQRLLLVRDRLGKKPLYYTIRNGTLYFGSELKCLRASGLPLDIDQEALRWEIAPTGVGVTVVCPGMVRTNIARNVEFGKLVHETLEQRGGSPEALAKRIVDAIRRDKPRVLFGAEPHI